MRDASVGLVLVLAAVVVAACGSSRGAAPGDDAGGGDDAALADAGACDGSSCPGATTKVQHLVVVIQENHTFDNYFGAWCTGATGSNPTCAQGPSCCEAGPAKDPGSAATPATLNDALNAARDPDHTQACELAEIDGGKMDAFATAGCGSPQNIAYADAATASTYWDLAAHGALADHYFQPVAGQSSSNDMFFARAQYVFLDNSYQPQSAIGSTCQANGKTIQYTDTTIADLLAKAGVGWAFYSEGYDADKGGCPTAAPADCTLGSTLLDCVYDPSDNPFAFYKSLVDDPAHFRDYGDLAKDIAAGTLPAVVFVKALEYRTEHPGFKDKISDGVAFVKQTFAAVESSAYAASTLAVLVYDEGGGYFDHVQPPPANGVDHQPYGTRIPFIATGPFARTGAISHAVMEHSSLVKFIEYNWLGGATGQLGGRDGDPTVANIGSMLDPALGVPEN